MQPTEVAETGSDAHRTEPYNLQVCCRLQAESERETLSQRYDEHNDTFRSYHPFFSALVGLVGLVAMPFLRQAHFPQWGMAGKRSDHRIRWGTTIPFLMRYGKVPSPVVKVAGSA